MDEQKKGDCKWNHALTCSPALSRRGDEVEKNIKCTGRRCGWIGGESELLEAQNPFIMGETIKACPKCGEINSTLAEVCDEPGCNEEATCGWPSPSGYRTTCGEHMRSAK